MRPGHHIKKKGGHRPARGTGRRSRSLSILSAIANGSLAVSAVLLAASAPWPRSRSIRRWQYDILHSEPNVDLEKMLRDSRQKSFTARSVTDIRRRRWARLTQHRGRTVLEITEEGRRRLFAYNLEQFSIPQPPRWDGRWRIILFDIPEKSRMGRDVLRDRLKGLGFLQLQRSAFVHPYPCEDQLDALIQHYRLQPHVTFFTTESLGYQEVKALARFKLRRSR